MAAIEGLGLFARLDQSHVPDRALRKQYRKRLWGFLKVHRRPGLLLYYVVHLAMHYHVSKLAKDMSTRESQLVNSYLTRHPPVRSMSQNRCGAPEAEYQPGLRSEIHS